MRINHEIRAFGSGSCLIVSILAVAGTLLAMSHLIGASGSILDCFSTFDAARRGNEDTLPLRQIRVWYRWCDSKERSVHRSL